MGILNSGLGHVVVGAALGLASAVYSLDGFGLKAVAENTGWQEWSLSPGDRLQPYGLGHFLSSGKVPTPSSTRYFVRSLDDDGNSLRGECIVLVSGPTIASRWWSISAGDAGDVTAEAVLSAGQAMLEPDGNLKVGISRQPIAGNWLKPDTSGNYTLVYVVSEPDKGVDIKLPTVKKGGC